MKQGSQGCEAGVTVIEEGTVKETVKEPSLYLSALLTLNEITGLVFNGLEDANLMDWLERNLIDGTVDLTGWFFRNIGTALGRLQTGQVQAYGTVIAFGALIIILAFLLT